MKNIFAYFPNAIVTHPADDIEFGLTDLQPGHYTHKTEIGQSVIVASSKSDLLKKIAFPVMTARGFEQQHEMEDADALCSDHLIAIAEMIEALDTVANRRDQQEGEVLAASFEKLLSEFQPA